MKAAKTTASIARRVQATEEAQKESQGEADSMLAAIDPFLEVEKEESSLNEEVNSPVLIGFVLLALAYAVGTLVVWATTDPIWSQKSVVAPEEFRDVFVKIGTPWSLPGNDGDQLLEAGSTFSLTYKSGEVWTGDNLVAIDGSDLSNTQIRGERGFTAPFEPDYIEGVSQMELSDSEGNLICVVDDSYYFPSIIVTKNIYLSGDESTSFQCVIEPNYKFGIYYHTTMFERTEIRSGGSFSTVLGSVLAAVSSLLAASAVVATKLQARAAASDDQSSEEQDEATSGILYKIDIFKAPLTIPETHAMTNIYCAVVGLVVMLFYFVYALVGYYTAPLVESTIAVEVVPYSADPFPVAFETTLTLPDLECTWTNTGQDWYADVVFEFPANPSAGDIFDLYYMPRRDDLVENPAGYPSCSGTTMDDIDKVFGYMLDHAGERIGDPIRIVEDPMFGGTKIGFPQRIRVTHYTAGPTLSMDDYSSYVHFQDSGGGYAFGEITNREFFEYTMQLDRQGGSLSTVLGGVFGIFNSIWTAFAVLAGLIRTKTGSTSEEESQAKTVPQNDPEDPDPEQSEPHKEDPERKEATEEDPEQKEATEEDPEQKEATEEADIAAAV
jgi:hypothetical protein